MKLTLNSEVIQALVPPTEASPDEICTEPVESPQLIRKSMTSRNQKSGRRRVWPSSSA